MKGRLGLETARVPQSDRFGLLWLSKGNLTAENGTVVFYAAGDEYVDPGKYALAFQTVNCILLQPGTTVSHDVHRLLSRHGTGLVMVGQGGVRQYAASMPTGPDRSALARRQALAWADLSTRGEIARKMYAWRLGEIFPSADIEVLRGIEGARMKATYRSMAQSYGIKWQRRNYERDSPDANDLPNNAINHASAAVRALAQIAVTVTGAIPQLGFIHEDSGISFALDVADIYRDDTLLPIAFSSVKDFQREGRDDIERIVRNNARKTFAKQKTIGSMIERIKELFPCP